MGVKGLKCPGCGAPINVEFKKNDGTMFCPYCGNAVKIEDSNTITINKNITKRTIDDAKIIRAENEKLEIEKKYKEKDKERKDEYMPMILLMVFLLFWAVVGMEISGEGLISGTLNRNRAKEMEAMGKISVGSCSDYEGDSYKEVEAQFKSMGFDNIELIDLKDSGLKLWKNGKVKSVSISGNTDFDENDYFSKDEKVVITYH